MNSPIASVGEVNLQTGEFEYGDIYDFWGEDTTYEVYRTKTNEYRVVSTAGLEPIVPIGETGKFQEDQTGEYLFTGECIFVASGNDGLKQIQKEYGTLIQMGCYK